MSRNGLGGGCGALPEIGALAQEVAVRRGVHDVEGAEPINGAAHADLVQLQAVVCHGGCHGVDLGVGQLADPLARLALGRVELGEPDVLRAQPLRHGEALVERQLHLVQPARQAEAAAPRRRLIGGGAGVGWRVAG